MAATKTAVKSTAKTTATKTRARAAKPAPAAAPSVYFEPAKPSDDLDFEDYQKEFWVPLWMVYPKPNQQRKHFRMSRLNELSLNQEENGQQEAIEVMYQELTPEMMELSSWDDEVLIVDEPPVRGRLRKLRKDVISIPDDWDTGNIPCLMVKTGETRHRSRVQSGKFDLIRVKIRPLITGKELAVQHGIENLIRTQLTPMEESAYFHELHTEHGMSVDEIATAMGYNDKQKFRITWRLKLQNLSPLWMEVVDNGGVTVSYKGNPKKIDIGEDPFRIAAEICDYHPTTAEAIPRHDLQDLLLHQIINHATRTGKLMDGTMMKNIRDGMTKPQAQQNNLEMVLPKSDLTDKAVAEFNKNLTISWQKLDHALKSQSPGHVTRCLEYLGDVESSGLAQVCAEIEKLAKATRTMLEKQQALNFAKKARSASDAALETGLSLEDVLAQINGD